MMTGFMRRTFVLDFEDPSFNGLEVRTRSASLGTLMRMQELMSMALGDGEHDSEQAEFFWHLGHQAPAEDGRQRILISWNLLDEQGQPVEISPEQLAEEEWPMIREIARAWVRAVTSVPRPLSSSSSDGDRSEELNLETLAAAANLAMTELIEDQSRKAEPATTGESPAPTTPDGSPSQSPWSWTSPPSLSEQSG
jgi:hypothetical protein